MNESGPSMVTTYTFKDGKEYIVKMKVTAFKGCQRNLELTVSDKYTAENWQSSYDAAYIENLTYKTGNYKHFDIFVAMLQSGLLKTSESISLDLLTFEDLELLRARTLKSNSTSSMGNALNNRRYLILTYTVEFDRIRNYKTCIERMSVEMNQIFANITTSLRIHYPLPLEYCGLPDPVMLQAIIRRLQAEIEKLQSTEGNKNLHRRIEQLTIANQRLAQENQRLSNGGKGLKRLLGSIKTLENTVTKERAFFQAQIQKLRSENASLTLKLRQLTASSGRKPGDGSPALNRHIRPASAQSCYSNRRQSRSRSPSVSSYARTPSLSPGSSLESFKTRRSPSRNTKIRNIDVKDSKIDLGNLESRIHMLQKMLKEGINLN